MNQFNINFIRLPPNLLRLLKEFQMKSEFGRFTMKTLRSGSQDHGTSRRSLRRPRKGTLLHSHHTNVKMLLYHSNFEPFKRRKYLIYSNFLLKRILSRRDVDLGSVYKIPASTVVSQKLRTFSQKKSSRFKTAATAVPSQVPHRKSQSSTASIEKF